MNNPLSDKVYQERMKDRNEDIRGPYFRDQTAILHSMPFRRLKHKTQVFFAPGNDHICTRIEHVMHVATIAATICKGLNEHGWKLNTEMAYAIGLGHDLGHAPFGHAGEEALSKKLGHIFIHEIHSYRVAQKLSNDGEGLNLTYGVADGIICHNGERFEREIKPSNKKKDLDSITDREVLPSSYEGCIVRLSDKIAYLGRDIEDALLANLIKEQELPQVVLKEVGVKNGKIINKLVVDVIENSKDKETIGLSESMYELINTLREFNYEKIYNHQSILEYKAYTGRIIETLYDYLRDLYCKNGKDHSNYKDGQNILLKSFGNYLWKMKDFYQEDDDIANIIIADYIAGMTDDFALKCMEAISIPRALEF